MRWIIWLLIILMGSTAFAAELEELSLKAGPTAPGEELSLLWLESFVYPKTVKAGEELSLGVRATNKVAGVKVDFDFSKDKISLQSSDGLTWYGAFPISSEVSSGLHLVSFTIQGEKGVVQRKLEFFVEKEVMSVKSAESVETVEKVKEQPSGWQLTLSATTMVFVNGGSRTLGKGEKITATSRTPFYKIVFGDGKESWISADSVEDPSAEYYLLGYEAYKKKDFTSAVKHYKNAVTLNPELTKGYFWLAKSYNALGDFEASYSQLKKFLKLEERSLEGRMLAGSLAPKLFVRGQKLFKSGNYSDAIVIYQKVVDLKPSSASSWIGLGQAYKNLGFENEAKLAWEEAKKYGASPEEVAQASVVEEEESLTPEESIAIVKESPTRKGTTIEKALKSVVSLTKSLGASLQEKGWQVKQGEKGVLVSYLCEQNDGKAEVFQWRISPDTRIAAAQNQNAKLLVERW